MNTPTIDRRMFSVPESGYFHDAQRKDLIVLGWTGSTTAEQAMHFQRKAGVLRAVPYMIGMDGRIYETFDPRAWAFHLNMPAQLNPAARNDRRSIAVNLVNPGWLKPRPDGRLAWWHDNYTRPWCSLEQTSRFVKESFRGHDYFATYTEAQFQALRTLLPWLCREHGIPWQLPAPADRQLADPRRWSRFRGILAHHHFRPEHADVGPAFDWDRIRPAEVA